MRDESNILIAGAIMCEISVRIVGDTQMHLIGLRNYYRLYSEVMGTVMLSVCVRSQTVWYPISIP